MDSDQGLQDDLAAQEAAARTWQPEIDVRTLQHPTPVLFVLPYIQRAMLIACACLPLLAY